MSDNCFGMNKNDHYHQQAYVLYLIDQMQYLSKQEEKRWKKCVSYLIYFMLRKIDFDTVVY